VAKGVPYAERNGHQQPIDFVRMRLRQKAMEKEAYDPSTCLGRSGVVGIKLITAETGCILSPARRTHHAEDRAQAGSTRHHTVLALTKHPSPHVSHHLTRAPDIVAERATVSRVTAAARGYQATREVLPHDLPSIRL
jgi:hypothetical protein